MQGNWGTQYKNEIMHTGSKGYVKVWVLITGFGEFISILTYCSIDKSSAGCSPVSWIWILPCWTHCSCVFLGIYRLQHWLCPWVLGHELWYLCTEMGLCISIARSPQGCCWCCRLSSEFDSADCCVPATSVLRVNSASVGDSQSFRQTSYMGCGIVSDCNFFIH